jgi:hypothetical protein
LEVIDVNHEVFHKAQQLHEKIIMITDIIESIKKDGIKLEYDVSTTHGKVPQRLLVDDELKTLVLNHYKNRLKKAEKEMDEL